MSDHKDSQDDHDPDYATPGPSDEAHQKLYEENARTTVARKITAIVDKEFSKEIDAKEKEILQIEERLHKALKTLHFLRYVIITDFYKRKQCQAVSSTSESKQTRIHPAIKQIIGKAPRISHDSSRASDDLAVASTSKDCWNSDNAAESSIKIEKSSISEVEQRLGNFEDLPTEAEQSNYSAKNSNGKRSQEDASAVEFTEDAPPRKIPRYVPPKSGIPEPQVPSRGARHKVRKRIVVGNISKWIPPDWREDAASHKWTMYVRGSKENAEIADFVGKVRFFLHPSYRPNDVVEVTSPPFHLSRRGWGEFPLRVQLHFKNPLNKPMDIIHYLKLDRTYTGLQTLGSETVVDVWIKIADFTTSSDSRLNNEAAESSIDLTKTIKKEPVDSESSSNCNDSIGHCCGRVKEEPRELEESTSHVHLEHDYANMPNESPTNALENENNVTISHSPARSTIDKDNDDNSSLSLSSINGESTKSPNKNCAIPTIYEEVVVTSEKDSTPPARAMSNGNYVERREFAKVSKNVESEMSIEACNSTAEFDGIDSSNIQASVDVATMASSLENSSPMLQPLRIAIPAAFEALRRSAKNPQQTKQILVLKDNKLIPINTSRLVVSGLTSTKVVKPVMQISRGVSLLKKPPNPPAANCTEKLMGKGDGSKILFKLNPTNSLILNSSNNIPALKIAEPSTKSNNGAQRLYLVEKKPQHRVTIGILAKGKTKSKETTTTTATEHWLDNFKIVTSKPKITLGKDRLGATSKKENYEEILRSIDEARITEVPALVRFIIRRLPLISEKATDPEYRILHPYACSSEKEYLDSNVGKQRALEWYRAKHVKSFLKKKGIPDEAQWSVKEIMIWSRLHGHTPIRSIPTIGLNSRKTGEKSSDKNLPGDNSETSLCTFTEPSALLEFLKTTKETKISSGIEALNREAEIEIIDVESISDNATNVGASRLKEEKPEKNTIISLGIPEKIVSLQSYVSDTARQIGVKLGPEEIVPGVTHCAPARMIVRAVQCLLEDLLRSSLAKAWERSSDGGAPDTITLEDVRGAILNREEFDVFTNEGLGSHHCPED